MSTPLQFQTLTIVVLSDAERIGGTLSPENAAIAIHAIHTDGLVCLENAVDLEHVAKLQGVLNAEVESLREKRGTNFVNISADGTDTGNMSQGPPLEPELMYDDVWANGPAIAAISGVLGPNPVATWAGGNTLLGNYNVARQNVHADSAWNHTTIPHSFAVNYFLGNVSEEYGSTELWLGSHTNTTFNDHLDEEIAPEKGKRATRYGIQPILVEARRAWAPPIYATIKKGSAVIRDMRLWHAGVPSKQKDFRFMLGFVYNSWCSSKMLVEKWAKQQHPVVFNAHFVGPDVENERAPVAGSFDSNNKAYHKIIPTVRTLVKP